MWGKTTAKLKHQAAVDVEPQRAALRFARRVSHFCPVRSIVLPPENTLARGLSFACAARPPDEDPDAPVVARAAAGDDPVRPRGRLTKKRHPGARSPRSTQGAELSDERRRHRRTGGFEFVQ
jgi:hypothetical protein